MSDKAVRRKVVTPVFRVSFPSLFQPERQMKDASGPPKYSITGIFDPRLFDAADKARWAEVLKIADEASMAAFKRPIAKLPDNFKKPVRKGEEKEHLGGYEAGTFFAKMSSRVKPGVVAADKVTPIDDSEAIYPGCYCRASITAYSYDNVSKGVSFGLSNVMFVRDGERLDSRTDAAEDFGETPAGDLDDLT